MAKADTRDDIERLIAGETVLKTINEELTYKELYDKIDHVWSVLFTTGYLTQRGKADGELRRLVIPNKEIHNIFMKQIEDRAYTDQPRLDGMTRIIKFGIACYKKECKVVSDH